MTLEEEAERATELLAGKTVETVELSITVGNKN